MKNSYIKFSKLLLVLLIIISQKTFSQVLISNSTGTPDNSAMLEIASDSKGVLIPRITTAQRELLHTNSTAKPGLLVFDKNLGSFFIYGQNSIGVNAWIDLSTPSGIWETDASNNVYLADTYNNVGIGTHSPKKKLVIKANNNTDTLFEIQDMEGKPLMIVTPTLTNFFFNHAKKGAVGGFAVGKYATAKATVDTTLFVVTPDSTRVYTSSSSSAVGGFAVGKYATAKGDAIEKSFQTNNDSTRVYTSYSSSAVGGFAVGKYATAKGNTKVDNYMYMIPKNYLIGHQSGEALQTGKWSGKYNTFFGFQTGMNDTIAGSNVFIGYKSGMNTTGDTVMSGTVVIDTIGARNVFLGYKAGYKNTTGTNNTFLGTSAGFTNNIGNDNVFIGKEAGKSISESSSNTFVGAYTGVDANSGDNNVFMGNGAGQNHYDGDANVFIGNLAGQNYWAHTDNSEKNVLIGFQSGQLIVEASSNVMLGNNAGRFNRYGDYNVVIGESAGYSLNHGSKNVVIGRKAAYKLSDGYQNVLIGDSSGYNNSTGYSNVFLGTSSGTTNSSGFFNVFLGAETGLKNSDGHENVFIGNGTGQSNEDGSWNVFIGTESGGLNKTGGSNVFIGQKTGNSMDASDYNTIIGCSAGENAQSGIRNVFLGYKAGLRHFGGNDNIFIGDSAGSNITGNDKISHRNVFLGNFAGANISEANDNVFIGNKAGEGPSTGITGDYNIAIGESAGNNISTGQRNVFLGNGAGFTNKDGSYNTFIGYQTGYLSTGSSNSMLGNRAGYNNTSGSGNTFMGNNTGFSNQTGYNNSYFGAYAGQYNQNGAYNTAMGYHAAERSRGDHNVNIGSYAGYTIDGEKNTFIGSYTAYHSGNYPQDGCIFLGYYAGKNFDGNNKLIIDNAGDVSDGDYTLPLIYGEFDNKLLRINGTLTINENGNDFTFPNSRGSNGNVLISGGNGTTSWGVPSSTAISARNGLSMNGAYVEMGGALNQNTNIFQGDYSMLYYLTGDGDFMIYNGSNYAFYVQDDTEGGNVGIGTDVPTELLTVYKEGGVTTKIQTDDGNSANLSLYENTSGTDYGYKFEYDGSDDKLHLWANGFTGNNYKRVTFLKDGKVGLGTTAPNSRLHVNSASGENALRVQVNGSSKLIVASNGGTSIGSNATTPPPNGLYVSSNVGIGTTAPNEPLEIAGNGRAFFGNGGGANRKGLLIDGIETAGARIEAYDYDAGTGLDLIINTAGAGNVGIGTTSPDYKLQVNGDVVPETNKTFDLGTASLAWQDMYYDVAHNMKAKSYINKNLMSEIVTFKLQNKKGTTNILDFNSFPNDLHDENSILTNEVTIYNYQLNYEQQVQINKQKSEINELKKQIQELKDLIKNK